jgi:hypothetical protein
MPNSPLGSFLLTLSTERLDCVDSGEGTMQVIVSDNAKMMRMTSCASYSSSNDSDNVVAATNVAGKTEIKPTNWDRLCSPISERRAVQQTLSLPRRKLSNDNLASMAKKKQRAARRRNKSSMSLTNKRNDPLRTKVSEDDLPGLRRNKHASTSATQNATFSIPQKKKIYPFTAIFPTPSKAQDLNPPLECPQRKPSLDNMLSMMKNRTSLRTPSHQSNASFSNESIKRNAKRALQNPFKTLVETPTKQESIHKKKMTVTIVQIPMPINPLASKTNQLPLKSALKTCSTRNHNETKSVTIISLRDHLCISNPASVNAFQAMMCFQQQEHNHHQRAPFSKNGTARRLAVVTLQKCIDLRDRSSAGYGLLRSLNGKAA